MNNDLKSSEALKAYAREVLCGNNPTNSLLIRMFDEIIDNAPPAEPEKVLIANVTFDKDKLKEIVQTNIIDKIKSGKLVLKAEEPQGEWGKWIIAEIQCPNCFEYFDTYVYSKEELKKCPNCGVDMRNKESPQAEAVSDRYDEGFRDGYAQCINDKEERKENSRLFQKGGDGE